MPHPAILVLTYDRPQYLRMTLDSLLQVTETHSVTLRSVQDSDLNSYPASSCIVFPSEINFVYHFLLLPTRLRLFIRCMCLRTAITKALPARFRNDQRISLR
jgi:hypothetical protein